MTKAELSAAVSIALSKQDLGDVDDSPMHGCALRGYAGCCVTIRTAARFLRWHVVNIDGSLNEVELNDMRGILRHKIRIVDVHAFGPGEARSYLLLDAVR